MVAISIVSHSLVYYLYAIMCQNQAGICSILAASSRVDVWFLSRRWQDRAFRLIGNGPYAQNLLCVLDVHGQVHSHTSLVCAYFENSSRSYTRKDTRIQDNNHCCLYRFNWYDAIFTCMQLLVMIYPKQNKVLQHHVPILGGILYDL